MTKSVLELARRSSRTRRPPATFVRALAEGRPGLDELQAAPVDKLDVEEKWITVPAEVGDVQVRIVKPVGTQGMLPVVLDVHGGGWVTGNAGTHDRLVRELAVGTHAAVVFVEYDRSPRRGTRYAIEQAYATAHWITAKGAEEGLDAARLAVAGDSVGGNMTAALTLMAKQRGDVTFVHQSLYCRHGRGPGRRSREFADGPSPSQRRPWPGSGTAGPPTAGGRDRRPRRSGRACRSCRGCRQALVIVDDSDVLRDEGEAYARRLTQADVHYEHPYQRHPAQLHDAQPATVHAGHNSRGGDGHSHLAHRPARQLTVLRSSTAASEGRAATKLLPTLALVRRKTIGAGP